MSLFFGFPRPGFGIICFHILSLYPILPGLYFIEKLLPPPPTPDFDHDKPLSPSPVKNYFYQLLGAEKSPGGGSNRKYSTSVLGVATVMWLLFLLLEFKYLYYVSTVFMICLEALGLWALFASWDNMRLEIKGVYAWVHFLKKYLVVYAGLSLASGRWYDSLSLVYRGYIQFLVIVVVPLLFEKFDDKAMYEIKKQFDARSRTRRVD